MPIIIPFDTGWTIILRLIDKLMYCILLLSWIFQDIVLPRLHSSIDYVCEIVLPNLCDWKCTPTLRRDKNRAKASHGAGKFSKKLRNSKNSCYNERNCKSGKRNRRHSFLRYKPLKTRQDANMTSLPDLKVKTRNVGETKYPSPCRQDRMIWDIHRRQVAEQLNLSNLS
jgi:hypothetical protein